MIPSKETPLSDFSALANALFDVSRGARPDSSTRASAADSSPRCRGVAPLLLGDRTKCTHRLEGRPMSDQGAHTSTYTLGESSRKFEPMCDQLDFRSHFQAPLSLPGHRAGGR